MSASVYKFVVQKGVVKSKSEYEDGYWETESLGRRETGVLNGDQSITITELKSQYVEIETYVLLDAGLGTYAKSSKTYADASGIQLVKNPKKEDRSEDDQEEDSHNAGNSSSKGYKFTFDTNGQITSVYEIKNGNEVLERIESDETWRLDDTNTVTKTEIDDGVTEVTTYVDSNSDGIFERSNKTYQTTDGSFLTDSDYGSEIDDDFYGTDNDDYYFGSLGNDTLLGGNGLDDLSGGDGNDVLDGGIDDDSLTGGDGNDNLFGDTGNDILYSGTGDDMVDGGSGDDLIIGGDGAGKDTYKGGLGNDTVKYSSAKAGITVNLSQNTGTAGSLNTKIKDTAGIGSDKLYDIENIISGNYDDFLMGSKASNRINGETGSDTINGGFGNDVLTGGSGIDRFVFNTKLGSTNIDTITDFGDGEDKIALSKSIFSALKKGITADNLVTGTTAELTSHVFDKNDFIIYDTETKVLSYDSDGSGNVKAVAFTIVELTGTANLDHANFLIT